MGHTTYSDQKWASYMQNDCGTSTCWTWRERLRLDFTIFCCQAWLHQQRESGAVRFDDAPDDGADRLDDTFAADFEPFDEAGVR